MCKKCGSTERPTAKYVKAFDAAICKAGSCPNDEHLHLACACGFSGIAPCADAKELGEPYTPPHGESRDFSQVTYCGEEIRVADTEPVRRCNPPPPSVDVGGIVRKAL